MKLIFMKPRRAALSILLGMFTSTESYTWIGPRIFDVWGLPKKKALKTAGEAERIKIREIAEELYMKLDALP